MNGEISSILGLNPFDTLISRLCYIFVACGIDLGAYNSQILICASIHQFHTTISIGKLPFNLAVNSYLLNNTGSEFFNRVK